MLTAIVLLVALTLVQLPVLVQGGPAGYAAALSPLIIAVLSAALATSQRRIQPSALLPDRPLAANGALFLVLMTVCFLRGVQSGTVPATEALLQIAILWTVFAFGVIATRKGFIAQEAVSIVLAGVTLYLLFNAFLQAAGWKSAINDDVAGGTVARMLLAIGVLSERTLFPTASGLNAFGVVGGIALAGGLAGIRDANCYLRKTLLSVGILAGAYVVLRTDSRIPLASAILAAVVASLLPMRRLRTMRFSVVLIPLLPIAIAALALAIAKWMGASALVRNPEELLSAGRRVFVWTAIAQELQTFRLDHLYGFGFFGQTASGVVQRFGDVVGDGYDTGRLSAHNMLLQNVLDIGYIGAASVLLLLWQALDRIEQLPFTQRRAFVAVVVFFLLSGGTESSPTPYFRESYVVLLLLLAYALTTAGRVQLTRDREVSTAPHHPPAAPAP